MALDFFTGALHYEFRTKDVHSLATPYQFTSVYPDYTLTGTVAQGAGGTGGATSVIVGLTNNDGVPNFATLGITYGYSNSTGERCSPLAGRWGDWTQKVANKLPQWHAGRKNRESGDYQDFLNGMTMSFDDINQEVLRARRNRYPSTADTFQPYRAYRANVEVDIDGLTKHKSSNLFLNSDFSQLRTARYRLPAHWSDLKTKTTGTVKAFDHANIDTGDPVVGSHAVELNATDGTAGYLHQSRRVTLPAGGDMTVSAWVNVPIDTAVVAAETVNAFRAGLYASIMYVDGSSNSCRVAFPNTTTGHWERVSATMSVDKPVMNYSVMINVTGQGRDNIALVDAIQLEAGSHATAWRDNPDDGPWYLDVDSSVERRGPLDVHSIFTGTFYMSRTVESESTQWQAYPKTRLFYTRKVQDFGDLAIPTRETGVGATYTAATLPTTINNKKYGQYTEEVTKKSWVTHWRISPDTGNQIQRYIPETQDIIGTYKIADRDLDQDGNTQYGVPQDQYASGAGHFTSTIRDFTILNGKMWLLMREVLDSSTPNTHLVLKIVSLDALPHSNFLECVHDIHLSTAIAANDTLLVVNDVSHIQGRPDQLLLTTAAGPAYFRVDFAYDYYMLAESEGQVITRHKYEGPILIT
jgi:hypothetical protein